MKAVVVGAGIAGLSTAIALRKAGLDVVVLERAERLEALGAGLVMSANAMRALDRLGVGAAVRARGYRATRARVPDQNGKVLFEVPYEREGWETYGVHRGDLQAALLDVLGHETVRLGRACTGLEAAPDGRRVLLAGGGAEEGDVLVGADGIRSSVRDALFGPSRLRYSGHIAWRAVTPFEHSALEGTFTETWGPRLLFGTVPIGGGRVYWYVSERAPEDTPLSASPKAEFGRRFADWHEPIPAVIAATDEAALSRTFIYDLPPLRRWGSGRATLVGDAAHPMVPNLGQGAAQALEDAVVLGDELGRATDDEAALRRYEARRRKRAARVVKQSRQAGQTAQVNSPLARALRNTLIRAVPERILLAQQRKLYEAIL